MTLAPPREPELVVEPELGDDTRVPAAAVREHAARQAIVVVILVLLSTVALVALFEGPLAKVWFNARQRHLTADFEIPKKRPASGDAAAILQAPKIDMNLVVVEGDSVDELRAGPGHRPETPLPGKLGNSVVVGHRAGWGGPFGDLHLLKKGDLIVAEARGRSDKVVFRVAEKAIVKPDDVRYLQRSNDYRLTLVTATGGNVSSDHLVVVAISGDRGRLLSSPRTRVEISKSSSFLNRTFILALLALALAAIAFVQLRRRHRMGATLMVVIPLTVAALLGLLLGRGPLALAPALNRKPGRSRGEPSPNWSGTGALSS